MSEDWNKCKETPPPEGVIVEIRGTDCWGEWRSIGKKVAYIKPPHKKMKKGCWRWVDPNGKRFVDQAVEYWKKCDDTFSEELKRIITEDAGNG